MAEGEARAVRECTIAQPMQAEGLFPPMPAVAATNGGDEQVFNGGMERGDAFRRKHLMCAHATALHQNLKQTDGDCDTVLAGHAAEVSRALPVAANTDVKRRNAIYRLGAQAYVGG